MRAVFDPACIAERMDARTCYEPNTGCWLWLGARTNKGYGSIGVGGSRTRLVHVVTYELERGPVPGGLQLDHLCRVRHCRSPYHLQPVTGRVNCLRGISFAAQNAAKTACPIGHPYSGNNLLAEGNGRRCRTCRRAKQRAAWRRRKEVTSASG